MGSFCNNDDSSPLVAAPIVSLTPATQKTTNLKEVTTCKGDFRTREGIAP